MKLMIVVGARPNFMKAAPLLAAADKWNLAHRSGERFQTVLAHTGQHYDRQMSDSFFTDLRMPRPDVHLCVGPGSHARQTADIMRAFERVLEERQPDAVVVVGDVNSTVGCALVAAKYYYPDGRRALIAHVEAGLRSFDRSMPEEINRVVTDHISDLLFVTEDSGLRNLAREGIAREKSFLVGNTMIDSLLAHRSRADQSEILDALNLAQGESVKPYALLTLHRPANVDQRDAFVQILDGLNEVSAAMPVIFPVHPRTRTRIEEFALEPYFVSGDTHGIRLTEPLGYLDFMKLMANARVVVTDSGGIQEETTCLGVPCVTARENTERPATVEQGTNILAGVRTGGIQKAIRRHLSSPPNGRIPEKWDGLSADRILTILMRAHHQSKPLAAALTASF